MKIVDRINEILQEKNISKKELIDKIIALDYKASKTGETPTESSIYAYLNGNIELKADLLPYIAEALNICEQELFDTDYIKILQKIYADKENINKYAEIIDLIEYLSPKTLEVLKSLLEKNKTNTLKLNAMLEEFMEAKQL